MNSPISPRQRFNPQIVLSAEDRRIANKLGISANEALKQINDARKRIHELDEMFKPPKFKIR